MLEGSGGEGVVRQIGGHGYTLFIELVLTGWPSCAYDSRLRHG
jgi:hypothetical protein